MFFPSSLFSQVGRCWKVQGVHDPDVLSGKLYLPLMEEQITWHEWHLFITSNDLVLIS